MVLPRWFLVVVSGIFAVMALTVLPWVIWQTKTSIKLDLQMQAMSDVAKKLDSVLMLANRVSTLERRMDVTEADIDDNIRGGLRSLERKVDRLELHMDTREAKIPSWERFGVPLDHLAGRIDGD